MGRKTFGTANSGTANYGTSAQLRTMPREPIYQQHSDSDDDDRDLRPQRMADMVGQRDVMARLKIAIDAATKRGEPLGHILFDGPPGLGKTTFAGCIPREMGVALEIANGAGLKAPCASRPAELNFSVHDEATSNPSAPAMMSPGTRI